MSNIQTYTIGTTFYVTPKEIYQSMMKLARLEGLNPVPHELARNWFTIKATKEEIAELKIVYRKCLKEELKNPFVTILIYDGNGECIGMIDCR